MAATATFLADFDQFVGETKRADATLVGLGKSADRVTADASTSFTNLGNTVRNLAGAFGVGLSIGAVVQFGRSVFDAASDIHDMGLKLGISAEAAQGFKFAAEQAGSTLEAVGTAITRMNVNLSEGNKGTVAALKAAGLEFANIRSLKPEEAFLAITDAIAKIPDPMMRSEVALQLFGKSAGELLPAINEGFRQASDGAAKMSNETIKSLEAAQDAWTKVGNTIVIATGGMIAKVIELWGTLREQNFGGFGNAAKSAAGDIALLPPVIHKTQEELKAEEKALKENNEEAEKARKAAEALETAWRKQTAALVAKMESEIRNAEGMARMNDDLATQERAILNNEGIWMMNRDAAMMATEARDAEVKAEIAAQAELEQSLGTGMIVVGQYANANKVAGEVAKAATNEAVQGYAAVGQQVAATGDAIRAYIDLQRYSAAANAILAENPLFTSASQRRRIAELPFGSGGGTTNVNVNVSGVFDTNAKQALTDAVASGLTQSVLQGRRVAA